jgi:hypothetical protein
LLFTAHLYAQRQKAAAAWQQTMSATGRVFTFANMRIDSTWESSVLDQVAGVAHMQDALGNWLQTDNPPAHVVVGRSIAVPRYDPIVDNLHTHPAFFNRTANSLSLDDAAYHAAVPSSTGALANITEYAQVIAVGQAQIAQGGTRQFVFCQGYAKVSSPAVNPLGMQPLVWEATPQRKVSKKARRANTVPGHFFMLDAQALKRQVCIVPDFVLGSGHFFINPLVHEAEDHLASVRGVYNAPAIT